MTSVEYEEQRKVYCYPYTKTKWSTLEEALMKCSQLSECSMFYDTCGREGSIVKASGERFSYCSDDAVIRTAQCQSGSPDTILYTPGNLCVTFIFNNYFSISTNLMPYKTT